MQKHVADMCGNLVAEVGAQTTVRLGGEVQALAVSSDKIGSGEISRRAPTEAERASALEVARTGLRPTRRGNYARQEDEDCKSDRDRVQAKGPDFLSRLKGFADIGGLDHSADRDDPNVIIRRALLLRSTLLKAAPDIVHCEGTLEKVRVDPGVLNAFLFLKEYKHGVRSLESVVRMSFLSGKASYDRSSLPSDSQMELHVDPDEFLGLVGRSEIGSSTLKWDEQ